MGERTESDMHTARSVFCVENVKLPAGVAVQEEQHNYKY